MQEFQQPAPNKMSQEEAQEVLRILAERQKEREKLQGLPSVQDVAVLADANVDEVNSVLAEIRSRATYVPQVRGPRSVTPLFVIGAVAAFIVLAIIIGGLFVATPMPSTATPAPPPLETAGPLPGSPAPEATPTPP